MRCQTLILMLRFGFASIVVVAGVSVASADWHFGENSFQDDFESDLFPGWIGATTSPGIGGSVLGPAPEFELGFMSFVDGLPPQPRFLDVSFDLPPAIGATGGPEVSFNGVWRSSGQIPFSVFRYHAQIASSSIPFPGLGDLLINFSYPEATGPVEFSLDNVIVDWSRPVPESSTLLLGALASIGLMLRRRCTAR